MENKENDSVAELDKQAQPANEQAEVVQAENEAEIEFTILDTSFTYGEPR